MATLFTKIINGELPGRFIWKDDTCVVFMTIAPLKPGHALVVPRQEVDHWLDADEALMGHLMGVARKVGQAIQKAYNPEKVGLMLAGLEVPHLHIHLSPIYSLADLDFKQADQNAKAEDLDAAAELLRTTLQEMGHTEAQA